MDKRLYVCIMKAKEKRNNRGYKIKDSVYKKAMRRAAKEKGTVANLIENTLLCYSYGLNIHAVESGGNGTSRALDIFSMDNSAIVTSLKEKI